MPFHRPACVPEPGPSSPGGKPSLSLTQKTALSPVPFLHHPGPSSAINLLCDLGHPPHGAWKSCKMKRGHLHLSYRLSSYENKMGPEGLVPISMPDLFSGQQRCWKRWRCRTWRKTCRRDWRESREMPGMKHECGRVWGTGKVSGETDVHTSTPAPPLHPSSDAPYHCLGSFQGVRKMDMRPCNHPPSFRQHRFMKRLLCTDFMLYSGCTGDSEMAKNTLCSQGAHCLVKEDRYINKISLRSMQVPWGHFYGARWGPRGTSG